MSHFPTAGHLISWAGLCPRLHESAGKRRSTRTRHGNRWLKTTLVQAAWGAVRHHHGGYLRAQFVRLRSRRGPKKAIVAVAASILTAAYHVLRDGVEYRDLGADCFDRRDKAKLANRVIELTQDVAPSYWRRYLALLLDGLRPAAATPLPAPPLTRTQLTRALQRLHR